MTGNRMTIPGSFLPPILQLEPTTACNLNCSFCIRKNLHLPDIFMTFDSFRQIITQYSFRYLTLHGWGEPLMNPELQDMIRFASKRKISVNFTTNGTLITPHISSLLDSGLDAIAFSLPENSDDFNHLPGIIHQFLAERSEKNGKKPKTYINIVLLPENLDNIVTLLRIAHESGVDIINFERSFPWSAALRDQEKQVFSSLRQVANELGCKVTLPAVHVNPCLLMKYTLFVRCNGDVAPCCYRADYILGNLVTDNPGKVLKARAKFMRSMRSDPICGSCLI